MLVNRLQTCRPLADLVVDARLAELAAPVGVGAGPGQRRPFGRRGHRDAAGDRDRPPSRAGRRAAGSGVADGHGRGDRRAVAGRRPATNVTLAGADGGVPLRSAAWLALTGVAAFAFLPVALVALVLLATQGQCPAAPSAAVSTAEQQLTVVGDSITVLAKSDLQARFPAATIESKAAMPWSWWVDQLRGLQAGGKLAPVVAVLLGTNTGVTPGQIIGATVRLS